MSFSRITCSVALGVLCVSGCGAPANGPTTPQAISQTNGSNGIADGISRTGGTDASMHGRLFWRPHHITLQKGVKESVKLFYNGTQPLQIADDCTGRVAFDQIGVARIRKYRIDIYEAIALRSGPFHCGVIAKVAGEPAARAILHVLVSP